MKKIALIVLALVLVLSLAACGEDSENNSTPPTNSESSTTPQGNGGTSSESPTENTNPDNSGSITKEEFLAIFGLNENDIKPEGFVNFDIWGCTTKEGTIYIQIDEASGVSENIQAWYEKVYDKLIQISDDGKLYESFAADKEYQVPTSYGNSVGSMFVYKYKGKNVLVNLIFDPFLLSLKNNEIAKISAYEIILAME